MKVFKIVTEICITGIQRYNYTFNQTDINKQLTLARDFKNQYDFNAIKVLLDKNHIGYVKKNEARILAPILKTNKFYVKKWDVVTHTTGYLVIQCIITEK